MKTYQSITVLLVLCLWLYTSCTKEQRQEDTLSCNYEKIAATLADKNLQLEVLLNGQGSPNISYQSSNDAIASVDTSGLITPHSIGTCDIIISAEQIDKIIPITITAPDSTQLFRIELSRVAPPYLYPYAMPHNIAFVTSSAQFNATAYNYYGNVISSNITWNIDQSNLATINQQGTLQALAQGNVKIQASANGITEILDFYLVSPCTYNPMHPQPPVPSISIPNYIPMSVGESNTLYNPIELKNTHSSGFSVSICSNDPRIVEARDSMIIGQNGPVGTSYSIITAKSPGKALLTLSCAGMIWFSTVEVVSAH